MKRVFLPPPWFALLFTGVGIYGTKLVFDAITVGGTRSAVIGTILLVISVAAVGTPLATAYHLKRLYRVKASQNEMDIKDKSFSKNS